MKTTPTLGIISVVLVTLMFSGCNHSSNSNPGMLTETLPKPTPQRMREASVKSSLFGATCSRFSELRGRKKNHFWTRFLKCCNFFPTRS